MSAKTLIDIETVNYSADKKMHMPGTCLHLTHTDYRFDHRIQKITASLAECGLFSKVVVVSRVFADDFKELEHLDEYRDILLIKPYSFPKGLGLFGKFLQTVAWNIKAFKAVIKMGPISCINCHSIRELPIGCLLKKITRAKLVYNTHDLEPEAQHYSSFGKKVVLLMEKMLIRYCEAVIVVSDSIEKWYTDRIKVNGIFTVRNVPIMAETSALPASSLREEYGIAESDLLFITHGVMEAGRGIDIMLDVFAQLPTDRHIVFMGLGPLMTKIQKAGAKCPNIHYHPRVSPMAITGIVSQADAGLVIIQNTCLSYYYCMPNKLFETVLMGVPAIVSNFPDMSAFVDKYGCGWKVEPSVDSLKSLIESLDRDMLNRVRVNALKVAKSVSWQNEEKTLHKIYTDLMDSN